MFGKLYRYSRAYYRFTFSSRIGFFVSMFFVCLGCIMCSIAGMAAGIIPDTVATETAEAQLAIDNENATSTAIMIQVTAITWTPSPAPTDTLTPALTVTLSETPVPTDTAIPPETPIPTNTPPPTFTLAPSETPFPTDTVVPTETAIPTNTLPPTLTLTPSETPVPTATPPPDLNLNQEFEGFTVSQINEFGSTTNYMYYNNDVGGIALDENSSSGSVDEDYYLDVLTEIMFGIPVKYGYAPANMGTPAYNSMVFEFTYDGIPYDGEIVLAGPESDGELLYNTLYNFMEVITTPAESDEPGSLRDALESVATNQPGAVTVTPSPYVEPTRAPETRYVTAIELNVREQARADSARVGKLFAGDEITVIASDGEWVEIEFEDSTAWVHGDFTSISRPTPVPATSAPRPTAAPSGPPCSCASDTLNCGDFSFFESAQECFDYCIAQGRGDVHGLDRNNNGMACENSW